MIIHFTLLFSKDNHAIALQRRELHVWFCYIGLIQNTCRLDHIILGTSYHVCYLLDYPLTFTYLSYSDLACSTFEPSAICPAITTNFSLCNGCLLDCANAIQVDVSRNNLQHLQCIQNTLTQVVTSQPDHISISKMLKKFHWLPVKIVNQIKGHHYTTVQHAVSSMIRSYV